MVFSDGVFVEVAVDAVGTTSGAICTSVWIHAVEFPIPYPLGSSTKAFICATKR